ncbi:M23 family metallopeptidase [Bradyrhizobium sp. 160]|uniref:M23 family metallopeptidase n=1 Tax=Bradyrhizobium sp. 160 TaxID=2782634 RepID=UPI001FF7E371|nr:M23 family metallopeptidase [Bradyrhizobium sp. 160]MCK1623185.1 M23 family metallopeptidase [Bradyrhizobium sp. 160]
MSIRYQNVARALLVAAGVLLVTSEAGRAQRCSYYAPGDLIPGTGDGVFDETEWAPTMLHPFVGAIGTTKSAIHSPGSQCAASNFDFVHRDTFCETRNGVDRESLNCPRRDIHQGIDINGGTSATCELMRQAKREIAGGAPSSRANIVPVLAAEDGQISYIGRYTVDLSAGGVRKYRYLHMKMDTLKVVLQDYVKQGQVLGYMWDDFGGNLTKFHLHLEVIATVSGVARHVSPYKSYVTSVARVLGEECTLMQ